MKYRKLIGLGIIFAMLVVLCGATWNADKPAVGNQISADIPDIEENFQELHDVITAITNGTLGTTTAANFKVDNVTTPLIWLKDSRATFEYYDADEIYIHAGAYHHIGTVSQIVYWSSKLTSDIGSPSASDWYYFYLDDSAIVTAGTNLLTATEFVWSNTEPAWSETKHGWYNGLDRCIFAVRTSSSSNIVAFDHLGDLVFWRSVGASLTETNINTTWTEVDLSAKIPVFTTRAIAHARLYVKTADAEVWALWQPNDGTSTGSIIAGLSRIGTDQVMWVPNFEIYTDSSQVLEVKMSRAGADTLSLSVVGWYLPIGM